MLHTSVSTAAGGGGSTAEIISGGGGDGELFDQIKTGVALLFAWSLGDLAGGSTGGAPSLNGRALAGGWRT